MLQQITNRTLPIEIGLALPRWGLPLLLVLVSGCAGRTLTLTDSNQADPSVNWVFDAGTELGLSFGIYPCLMPINVSGGAATNDRLIVLCNLGGASELIESSRVYIIAQESGKVLKNIAGPAHCSPEDWRVTSDHAYVTHDLKWGAIDLEHGGFRTQAPPEDQSLFLEPAAKVMWKEIEPPPSTRWELDLERGRRVLITVHWEPPTLLLQFARTTATGQGSARTLCRLPNRPYGGGQPTLLVDDHRFLIFSWGEYVICLDPKKLAEESKS